MLITFYNGLGIKSLIIKIMNIINSTDCSNVNSNSINLNIDISSNVNWINDNENTQNIY